MKTMCATTESHRRQLYAQQHLTLSEIIDLPSHDTMLLKTFAPWLLLTFLGQQVSLSLGARSRSRGADKAVTPAPGRAQRAGLKSGATGRGKFSIQDKMQCTWGTRNVGDTVTLSVRCETGEARTVTRMCQYVAKPQSCPGYLSDSRGFWKQVGRALKRLQDKVCSDERALVKAGMCKRAPRHAHFKLHSVSHIPAAETADPGTTPSPPPPSTSAPAACTGRADHRKTAEEYCGAAWASVCSVFFTLLQSDC